MFEEFEENIPEGLIIYFITKGPVSYDTDDGDVSYTVEGQVSDDGGETVTTMLFRFETHEYALDFKNKVNNKIEPTII